MRFFTFQLSAIVFTVSDSIGRQTKSYSTEGNSYAKGSDKIVLGGALGINESLQKRSLNARTKPLF